MQLVSVKYIAFISAFIMLYYLIPKKIRWITLLLASYIFYLLSSPNGFIYLLASTVSIYIGGLLLERENKKKEQPCDDKKALKRKIKKNKKDIVFLIILFNFSLLALLKYFSFVISNINHVTNLIGIHFNSFKFIVPLGISYYTLMAVSYITDIYRGKIKADKNLGRVALYLSFFPYITEGPIGKFESLKDQLYKGHSLKFKNLEHGFTLILWGYFKKMVIADRANIYVNLVFGATNGGLTIIIAGLLYTLQIYAEFSGCMDIVRGTAKMFGITLDQNFEQPFFSRNVQEFWRRWHITLGRWIREYIFYPISLSKLNMKVNVFTKKVVKNDYLSKFIITAFPLLFVWLFNGIWHGASYKYVAYGMYYYIIMMIGLLFAPLFKKIHKHINDKLLYLIDVIRTNILVIIGMMLFRSHSLMDFFNMIKSIFKVPYSGILNHDLTYIDFIVLLVGAFILFLYDLLKEKNIKVYKIFKDSNFLIKYIVYLIIIFSIVIFGIYGEGYNASDFIYGAF